MSNPIISFAEFVNLEFDYKGGMHGEWGAHRAYRNEEHGVQVEVVTARGKNGQWKKGQRYWFLDGDEREFETAEACYNAYRWLRGAEAVELSLPSETKQQEQEGA